MEMSTEVAGTNNAMVGVGADMGREVSAQNILIPKILACQPTSDLGDVPQGHLVRSTDGADLGKTVTVIPLSGFRNWVNFDVSGGKPVFRSVEPCTYQNENLAWEYEENGVPMRRDQSLNFYCLIPSDIDREKAALASEDPDPDDALLPVVISFSRTSIKVGKEILTQFARIDKFRAQNPNVSLYPNSFELGLDLNVTDKGKWYTWRIMGKAKTDLGHRETCAEWHKTIGKAPVVVHDAGEYSEAKGDKVDKILSDDVPF